MSIFSHRIKVLPAVVAIGLGFIAGIGTQALTPSPYDRAKRWIAQGTDLVERLLGKQKRVGRDLVPAEQSLDTA
ncbi:MAG: hypothetical protein ACREC1_02660, partial [Methylovirgula sp.]